ncbi:dihydrolipoamide acetyltransferase family protein [Nocardia aurantia]|uniref:Dihydrolipoamide acetyltransferase component of pyruvate dehydrogenase complex n=1 Tax=Nocardia aurantia TaxID=2585199 RepID=A0A7K0DMX3_9NOCA|nr:dihydrolipoamide acetyltransferase family protein [Nocardia aurantia]MQY26692.1 Dihydrolipoyllysine-residue acetyltransferase component of pyruvate dehydrogenase complex [Nocardia aurantia]
MSDIVMPRLSDTMEEGVVVSWLKQVGDRVSRGEVLAEIETDKALMELEAYDDGVLERIVAEAGARVPIGTTIALLGDGTGSAVGPDVSAAAAAGSGTAASGAPESAPGLAGAAPASDRSTTPAEADSGASGGGPVETGVIGSGTAGSADGRRRRPKSSPLARKIAAERGVDLAVVTGTGPGGRITRRDVENAPVAPENAMPATSFEVNGTTNVGAGAAAAPASGDYDEIPLTTIQRVSAVRLTESKQQAPHIYLTSAIDVTDLLGFRVEINRTLEAAGAGKVSVNDLLVKAVATTLRLDPAVNVSFAGDKLLQHKGIHLGIAVATPAGLLVPVVRDADRKSVSEIARESRDKAERARDRKLRADEMSGGTFTISNLGMFGVEQFTAVINPPESAILAVGGATDELRLDGGEVVTRKILRVTLSADHRAIDGAVAARFLQQLKSLLENPLRIVA